MVVSKVTSSISRISERRRCRREGYNIHHTSLGGSRLLAEAKNAAAPGTGIRVSSHHPAEKTHSV